ncbi:MAG TPA: hypothetical protein VN540_05730 [Clostridia bacterium]|nr:hypothetical protein [Clostridia bacterium]
MSIVDVICTKSCNASECPKYSGCIDDKLRLGPGFSAYLYFTLPPATYWGGRIVRANVILYKIPSNTEDVLLSGNRYRACPLLDFFSIYGNAYAPPKADDSLCVYFEDDARMSYTEIDITAIAQAWAVQKPENKGLVLSGCPGARRLLYASDRFEIAGMRPMLRLVYEGITQPLKTAPCTVKVD